MLAASDVSLLFELEIRRGKVWCIELANLLSLPLPSVVGIGSAETKKVV